MHMIIFEDYLKKCSFVFTVEENDPIYIDILPANGKLPVTEIKQV